MTGVLIRDRRGRLETQRRRACEGRRRPEWGDAATNLRRAEPPDTTKVQGRWSPTAFGGRTASASRTVRINFCSFEPQGLSSFVMAATEP